MWNRTLADFPPSEGWTLTYYLTGRSSFQFDATPDLTNGWYAVSVPPTGTTGNQNVTAGPYRWSAVVSLGTGETHPAAFGTLIVEPNPNIQNGTDARSHAEIMLAILEAEIQARITGTGSAVQSYAIDGRSINKMPLTEILQMRGRYAWEVAAQTSGGKPAPITIQFGRRGSASGRVGPNTQWDA